jgi:TorA maturation chaperone TorD
MPSTNHSPTDDEETLQPRLQQPATWRDLHVVLAAGLRHPDERLRDDLESETFAQELTDRLDALGLDLDVPIDPPSVADRDLTADYVALFEAGRTPYAPPAESPYKPWYGSRDGGLMGGPPAADMTDRYDAIGASVPDEYPADHVALLLEYGSYLLEAGDHEAYREFVAAHLDWLPSFRQVTRSAAAEAPFHRWLVDLTAAVVVEIRDRLDVPDPAPAAVDRMVDRTDSGPGSSRNS